MMAQQKRRGRRPLKEAVKPVKGSSKGPVSAAKQNELDAAEKAEKDEKETGSTPKSGPVKKENAQYSDKFQQMLEYLVNEDQASAEALFHDIVVEKSRSIYENLLAEEEDEVEESDDEEVDEADEDVEESDDDLEEDWEAEVDESDDEEVDEADEEVDEADEEVDEDYYGDYVEADDDLEMGGDPEGDLSMDMDDGGDDMGGDDMAGDDMDMDAEEGGDTDEKIADLEAELADLKAEFEELMAGEEGGDDDMDMGSGEGDDDMDMGDEEGDMGDEEGDMDMEEPAEEESFTYERQDPSNLSAAEQMREYVEKVGGGKEFPGPGKMGDNGVYTKSPVASKNDMGGTTTNLLNAGTSNVTTVAAKGQLQGAQMQSPVPKVDDAGNVNKPGAKAAKSFYKNNGKGYGAEKTGAMSKETAADKGAGSPLNGAPKRAK